MRKLIGWIGVMLLSTAVAFALSFVPGLDRQRGLQGKADLRVFQPAAIVALSDGNLVDFMLRLPLASDIRRVEWSQSMLSVDLETPPEKANEIGVYRDLTQLALHGLGETDNVRRIYVRVYMADSGKTAGAGKLLAAMSAGRESYGAPPGADGDAESLRSYLTGRYSVTFTALWDERFGQ